MRACNVSHYTTSDGFVLDVEMFRRWQHLSSKGGQMGRWHVVTGWSMEISDSDSGQVESSRVTPMGRCREGRTSRGENKARY